MYLYQNHIFCQQKNRDTYHYYSALLIRIQPPVIGWKAKKRNVGMHIETAFNGEELVRQMKAYVTAIPNKVIEVANQYGNLRILDDRELVIEAGNPEDLKTEAKQTLSYTLGPTAKELQP
jgi:hypothetical protein